MWPFHSELHKIWDAPFFSPTFHQTISIRPTSSLQYAAMRNNIPTQICSTEHNSYNSGKKGQHDQSKIYSSNLVLPFTPYNMYSILDSAAKTLLGKANIYIPDVTAHISWGVILTKSLCKSLPCGIKLASSTRIVSYIYPTGISCPQSGLWNIQAYSTSITPLEIQHLWYKWAFNLGWRRHLPRTEPLFFTTTFIPITVVYFIKSPCSKEKCTPHPKYLNISRKSIPLYSPSSPLSSKTNPISRAPILAEMAYLAMLFILQALIF